MYRLATTITMIAFLGVIVGLTSKTPDNPHATPSFQDQRTVEGVARCKTCHRKPEQGEQFSIWEESAHSKAYATLASEEALKIAKEKGIENPQTDDACLKCHVTGHGVAEEFLGKKYSIEDGVGCESCHGAGGDYYKKKTMVAIAAGEIEGASVGFVKPTVEVCESCHNEESPTFKDFDYDERVKSIAHPIPEGGSDESEEDEG
jgi:hypothetical protein